MTDPEQHRDLAEPLQRSISRTRRLAAVVSIASWALLVAILAVLLLRNVGHLLLGFTGLLVTVVGIWWVATERRLRRLLGGALTALGFSVLLLALTAAFDGVTRIGLRLALLVALYALSFATAQFALRRQLHVAHTTRISRVEPPGRPVLLCNPWSGGGKVEKFELPRLAEERGVDTVMLAQGLDLEQLAREAVARGADCLGMAGGDGSQALVASIAIEHGLPHVVIPAGTRNHLALDLALDRDDPRPALAAFTDGIERAIDYGTVNGRLFVNNVSLGIYATIVQEDSYRDDKVGTTAQLLPELLGSASEPFDLQFTGPAGSVADGAYLVQVSNNPYQAVNPMELGGRLRLDTGQLGVVALWAYRGFDVARLVPLAAANRLDRSGHSQSWTCADFTVESRSGTALAGVDGEALELATPLEFRIHPGGLRLLVPEGNLEAAEQRRSRDVRLRNVLAVAMGEPNMA